MAFQFVAENGEINGFKGDAGAQAAFLLAKSELCAKSTRAKAIIELVETSQHIINILIGKSVGQESAFAAAPNLAGVSQLVWDSKHAFHILVNPTPKEKTTTGRFGRTTQYTEATLSPLPANLVLIHELGHAAQFIGELPSYAVLFASGSVGIAVIEADNLARNEHPICVDYGLPTRSNYLHYNGSSDSAVSKWTKV